MGRTKPAKDSRLPDTDPRASLLPTIILAVLAAGYFAWFFLQSPKRLELLRLLQDPFSLVAEWFGPAGTAMGLLDRVPVLAMATLILIAANGLGRVLLGRLRLAPGITELERSVLAIAVGLNGLSTIVLLLGLAGGLGQRWLLWLIVGCLAGLAGWQFYRDHWSRLCGDSALRTPHSALAWISIPLVILLLGACLPPWDFDVREYHLQVPKEWFQQGQVTFLPHNVYGNMPLGAEMHALLAMALWPGEHGWFYGALAGKVVMASFALITALGVAAAGERIAGRAGGILAAVVFVSHPWVIHVSISGLNDGVLACYVFLAVYAMWLARQGACSFLVPGLLAGAAAACKYPGLVFAVAPLAVWAMVPVGRVSNLSAADGLETRPTVVISLALFLAGLVAGGGAWYVKNAAFTGNPVYPLAYSVLGGTTRTAEKDAQWSKAHQVPPDSSGWRYSPVQFARSLARIAGQDDFASPLVLPLLAALCIAAATVGLSRREGPGPQPAYPPRGNVDRAAPSTPVLVPDGVRNLLFVAVLALLWILAVWWLLSHRLDRFLLPAWPFAAMLAAGAAWPIGRWWQWTLKAVLLVGLGYCYLAAGSQMLGDNRWFVSLEQLRRDEPWPEGTPRRVKPAHKLLNERIQPGQAVLLVGDAVPFDLEMRVYYNTCFDDCLFCNWMLGKSADERRQELATRNIASVVVDWLEIERYRSVGNYGFDPRFDGRLLDELVSQGILGPPESLVPPAPDLPRSVELYPVAPATTQPPAP